MKKLINEIRIAIAQLFLSAAYFLWPKEECNLPTIQWFSRQPLDSDILNIK